MQSLGSKKHSFAALIVELRRSSTNEIIQPATDRRVTNKGTEKTKDEMEKNAIVPSVELSRVAIVAEYRGHAFSAADIADGGRVPPNIIHSVFHGEFRIRFQYFRLGAVVVPHQIRPNKLVIEPFEPRRQCAERQI